MQQNIFPDSTPKDKKEYLGFGLEIEITKGYKPKAKLYRAGTLIKIVDLSDKVAKRLFIIEAVELGAIQTRLADTLGVSRQTIHNYRETYKEFGQEGLVNSYRPSISKSRSKQRDINKEQLPRGNKARKLEEIRRKRREKKEQENVQQSLFSSDRADENITADEQPFSEVHGWLASRYAGVFVYLICLVSGSRWLEFISGYFGDAYKIFMVFVLMVGRNIPSIEQLKNIHPREAGLLLGLKKMPSRPKLWEWFYTAANLKKADLLTYDYFRIQIVTGTVSVWSWFIDGHLLPYTGKEKVHYSYNTQRRMPVPGRTNIVTCDDNGRIVDFDIQEGKGNLRNYIITLKKRWSQSVPGNPLMVFDREGYGGDFFNGLIENDIPFVTWDKYVDTAKLAEINRERFNEEITVNGKKYNLFEGEKRFTCSPETSTTDDRGCKQKYTFAVRRIYIWNRHCNRRTCGLAWTGKLDVSTADCAQAILNRWGASENTFKHLKARHPFHYHPGFQLKVSEKQEISHPDRKKISAQIKTLRQELGRLFKRFAKAKDIFKKNGDRRKNSAKEKLQRQISDIESELTEHKRTREALPEKIDASKLENYKSFKQVDNEGKNLLDFVTSSMWNARKQMVDWLGQSYDQDNEVVDLFYAITNCHGWVKSNATEVVVRLEPISQPKRRAAQQQFCRKLTSLCARLPSGKFMVIEVGENPTSKVSKK